MQPSPESLTTAQQGRAIDLCVEQLAGRFDARRGGFGGEWVGPACREGCRTVFMPAGRAVSTVSGGYVAEGGMLPWAAPAQCHAAAAAGSSTSAGRGGICSETAT